MQATRQEGRAWPGSVLREVITSRLAIRSDRALW
jgi:hypothetical protein